MRDSADELPQALQPLGLGEPPFHPLLLRDGPQAFPLGLGSQPLGGVPDRGRDQRPVLHRQPAQGDLRGEPAAVPAQPG